MKIILKTTFRSFLQDDTTGPVVQSISNTPRVPNNIYSFATESYTNNKHDLFSCFPPYCKCKLMQ